MRRAGMWLAAFGVALSDLAAPPPALAAPAVVMHGHLRYEYRAVRPDFGGLGKLAMARAGGVPYLVHAGDRVLASGITELGSDLGGFRVTLPAGTTGASIVFTAAQLDEHGLPTVAVVRALHAKHSRYGSDRRSGGLWSWSFPARAGDLGDLTVRVADGSGALHIYRSLIFNRAFADRVYGRVGPGYDAVPSLAALWAPGLTFKCGGCFEDSGGAALTVEDGDRELEFDTVMWLDGSEGSAVAWTEGVVNHELGHYVMAAYGVLPDNAMEHTLVDAAPPVIGWSEGWATFWGQVVMSARQGRDDAHVVDMEDGVVYAYDLASATSIDPTYLGEKPDKLKPKGGMSQRIAEGTVASLLWRLRSALGQAPVLSAMADPRMIGPIDRGARGKDLVDFLDALVCSGRATAGQIDAEVRERFGFPYDGRPRCPK